MSFSATPFLRLAKSTTHPRPFPFKPNPLDSPPHHRPALVSTTIRPTPYRADKPHRDRPRPGHFDDSTDPAPPSGRPARTVATILAHPIRTSTGRRTRTDLFSARHSSPPHSRHAFAGVPATSTREAAHVG